MPTVRELFEHFAPRLEQAGVLRPRTEARLIIGKILGLSDETFENTQARIVEAHEETLIVQAFELRESRVPTERIFGSTSFYGLTLKTAPGVFQPYPETETLIEHVLLSVQPCDAPLRLLDVGTGSGCILLALLNQLPNATGLGVDADDAALQLAQINAANCGLSARVSFRKNDWCENLEEQFDLIVCNPPSVPTRNLPFLLREMRTYDPELSLHGGEDGLDYYRRLASRLATIAKPNAKAFVQVGEPDIPQVLRIFKKARFDQIDIKTNYRRVPMCLAVTNRQRATLTQKLQRWRQGKTPP